MNEFEKIVELLEKESITSEEKIFINSVIEKDPDAKKIYKTFLLLKNSLKRNEHIDEELMAEYVMYKNNISSDRSIVLLANKVEDHIRKCIQCERLFKELNAEYCKVDSFVSQTVVNKVKEEKPEVAKGFFFFNNFSTTQYAFASLAAVVVLYLGLFAISSFTTPSYKKSFLDGDDFYTTRGRTSELFQRGLDAIDKKNYASAIKYLDEDASKNQNEVSIFYTHFVLGITYIHKAESDFLGLFKSFDKEDVAAGIENFEKSIELNKSGKFDNLKLDAEYFVGKSYLMIDDVQEAKKHFQIVINGKGSYYKDAEDLIKKL
jgi:tetratricopeptide (TPR) repeat protein